jgi:hypothetical protein
VDSVAEGAILIVDGGLIGDVGEEEENALRDWKDDEIISTISPATPPRAFLESLIAR